MASIYSNHFNHNFEIDLSRLPVRKTDRMPSSIMVLGVFFGSLLMMIGIYELLNGFNSSVTIFDDMDVDLTYKSSLLSPFVFDMVIIVIGLGIVASTFLSYLRYKKIYFDGTAFVITHRPMFGDKVVVKEGLDAYDGIRYRMEFFQYGFLNKNKHIIELFSKDIEKVVPLYISTKNIKMNPIIEKYAKILNKPIIISKDDSIEVRTLEEFSKNLIDMKDKFATSLEGCDSYKPKMVACARKGDKVIIKVKKVLWDAYNLISLFAIISFSFTLVMLVTTGSDANLFTYIAYLIAILGILIPLYILFRRDKIIVKPEKIIVHHKFLGISKKHNEIFKMVVKSIEVVKNPATGRSFIVINSNDNSMIFGKKLSADDLKWVRIVLIREVLGLPCK